MSKNQFPALPNQMELKCAYVLPDGSVSGFAEDETTVYFSHWDGYSVGWSSYQAYLKLK